MSTETLYVDGAGDLAQCDNVDFDDNYLHVQADDSSFVYTASTTNKLDAHTLQDHAANYGAINSVTVWIKCRKSGSSASNAIAPLLRLSGTNNVGSNLSITTTMATYSATITRPGGGSWSAADIDNLQVGYQIKAASGQQPEVEYVYVVVDYTPGNHPAPTSLECERATNPTNASDDPVFSAIWNANGGSGTATHAYIQVSTVSDFASTVWDSGWIDITDISHGVRCQLIDYNGSGLSTDPPDASDWYYWRIKFKDGSSTESSYSTYATFKVTERAWWNRAYDFRQKVLLNSSHGDLPDDTTLRVNFKSGNRTKIATNGCFNEALQEMGSLIADYADRVHVVYLSETGTDGKLGIHIQSYNKNTKVWGTPYRIDDAKTTFDTHNAPALCIDNNGYLHVFYGCHGSPCYYTRSTQPNQSGAFAGDGGGGAVWTTPITLGSRLTYPQAFVVPSTNRIVLVMRSWNGDVELPEETKVSMFYSTDGGANWSSERAIIYFTETNRYRVYCYGCRFDPKRERLHLGFSFVVFSPLNMTKGAWYAYSDFDSGQADGFAAWKKIDGSSCGTTHTSPISYTSAGAVRLNDTGDINIFFCRHVALTKSGDPLVFWSTAPWYLDPWGQEAAFGMSRWNGSAWVHSNITEDYDIMMRTDRAGVPTLVDADGVIHTFTAVDSVLDKHQKPTANGNYTNVTVTGAASAYQAVDDGVSFYDNDDTYCGKTTATGEASFTSSEMLPNNITVLAVGIDIILRGFTGSESFSLFLRIGGTDYAATAIVLNAAGEGQITAYQVKRVWWTLNPSTSAAWTKAQAEGVEFGVKQTASGKTWRFTRIQRLVKIRYATNAENYASEVVEMTSKDLGATWAIKRLTDNSAIGVPILNIKHSYTNRQIDLAWVSGNDIFYLDTKPYGRARRDARDVRVVWQGNGAFTELHRIIDYANLENTLIEFRIPEAISSSKIAGSKDLYIYSGNPDVADNPLSDPHTVYPLMYENWETLTDGTSINGLLGWTVTSGIGRIYSSPPNHNNKVYAGANSLNTLTDAFVAEKTFSPTLTDVVVESAIWVESGSRSYLQAVNASSAVFSVGINNSTGYACYEDGSGWHDHATVRASGGNMNRVRLVVNASGCSAWVNGQQIASNVTAITSITKIKLGSANQTFFDAIKISRWYATAPVLELQSEEVSGFTLDMALLGAGIEQFSIDMKLDKYFVRSGAQIPTESKAALQAKTQLLAELRSGLQARGVLSAEFSSTFGATLKAQVESLMSLASTTKAPVESASTLQTTTRMPAEELTTLVAWQQIFAGWRAAISANTPLPVESLAAQEIRTLLPADYKGTTAILITVPIEYLNSLTVLNRMPNEYLYTLIATGSLSTESLGRFLCAVQIPVEYRGGMTAVLVTPVETLQQFTSQLTSLIEVNQLIAAGVIQPVESLRQVFQSESIPVEWAGQILFSMSSVLPVEFLGSLQVNRILPVEANVGLASGAKIPVDFSGTLQINSAAAIEWLHSTEIITRLHAESLSVVAASNQTLIEILMRRFATSSAPVELAAAIAYAHQLAVEWRGTGTFEMSAQLPVDWRATIDASGRMEVESLSVRTLSALLPAESLKQVRAQAVQPVDIRSVLSSVIAAMSIEFGRKFATQSQLPIDMTRIVAGDLRAAIEENLAVMLAAPLPVEFSGAIAFSVSTAMPVDWRASVISSLIAPAESRATLNVVGGRFLIESGRSFAASNRFALEYGQSLKVAQGILADWLGAIGATGRMTIDYTSPVSGSVVTNIEFNKRFSVESRLNVEQLHGYLAGMKLPVEWIGVFLAVLAISEARLLVPELGGALLRTSELSDVMLRTLQLSRATMESIELNAAVARTAQLLRAKIRRQ